jgi:hypothetical protein
VKLAGAQLNFLAEEFDIEPRVGIRKRLEHKAPARVLIMSMG